MTGSDAADANKHDRKADATPPSGFSSQDDETTNAPEDFRRPWRYWPLWISLPLFVFLLHPMTLLCCCREGAVKLEAGHILDLLLLLRVVAARIRNERGRGWIFYLALLWSSAVWLEPVLLLAVNVRRALLHH